MTSDDPARTLVLLRHAKSDWPPVADHERPLAARGRRDAPEIGRVLAAAGIAPDLVLCSTATRARQTWELAAAGLAGAPEVSWDVRIYGADPDELIEVIHEVPADVGTLLVVGHNPGAQELIEILAGHGDPAALRAVRLKFPTGAFAVLSVPSDWAHLAPGEADLTRLEVPRG